MRILILLLFLHFCFKTYSNKVNIDSREKVVSVSKNSENYEHTIKELTHFLTRGDLSSAEGFKVYLLKANLYKKLYKYEHALHFL